MAQINGADRIWRTPKTDWYGVHVNGEYRGDYFTYQDFNRIIDNVYIIYTMFINLHPDNTDVRIYYNELPMDHAEYAGSWAHATHFQAMIDLLKCVSTEIGFDRSYEELRSLPLCVPNGRFLYFYELNILEKAIGELFDGVEKAYNGGRRLAFHFGTGYGI